MDSEASILMERAGNEMRMAKAAFAISQDDSLKDAVGADRSDTFYSAAISHSYYSIFYAAKALLLTKGIKTSSPEVHKKTINLFEQTFVKTGILDVKLFEIYQKLAVRADSLLEIFKEEKAKRGTFTYKTIPQANIEPAADSIENARIFLTNIKGVI